MGHPDPLTEEEVKRAFSKAVNGGTFKHSGHLFKRIPERNLSIHDVRHIVQNGKLIASEWHEDRGHWRYELRCKALDKIETSIVLADIPDEYCIIGITMF